MDIAITFRWNRDEIWESMSDNTQPMRELLQNLLTEYQGNMTAGTLRHINQEIRDENDRLTTPIIKQFLMEDLYDTTTGTMPRYAHYVRFILEGLDDESILAKNPINSTTYMNVIKVIPDVDLPSLTVNVTLNNIRVKYSHLIDEILSMRSALGDTLWEGAAGDIAVHYSGATIDFIA